MKLLFCEEKQEEDTRIHATSVSHCGSNSKIEDVVPTPSSLPHFLLDHGSCGTAYLDPYCTVLLRFASHLIIGACIHDTTRRSFQRNVAARYTYLRSLLLCLSVCGVHTIAQAAVLLKLSLDIDSSFLLESNLLLQQIGRQAGRYIHSRRVVESVIAVTFNKFRLIESLLPRKWTW